MATVEIQIPARWWNDTDRGAAARAMQAEAETIEFWSYGRRYQRLLYMRMFAGRDLPNVYGLSMTRGGAGDPAFAAELAGITAPKFNAVASCIETLVNKLGRARPWVQFLSDGGDSETRARGEKLTRYTDGIFYATHIYRHGKLVLQDALVWGDGFLKIYEDEAGDIALERVISDELLVDEDQAARGNVRQLFQRRFPLRDDALDAYADRGPEVVSAILRAQRAVPGLNAAVAGMEQGDRIAMIEGWRLPTLKGKPGRRMLVCGGVAIEDEEWTRKGFPFAKLSYNNIGLGWWSQGLVEVLAPIQSEINRITETVAEAQRRMAVPRIFVDKLAGVTAAQFANKVGALVLGDFKVAGPPVIATPPAIQPEMYQDREAWIQKAYKRSGVAEDSAAGEASDKVRSGAAERLQEDIRSQRFITLGQAYEDFYADAGCMVLEQASETRPQVIVPGRGPLKWSDAKADLQQYRVKGFPVSSFPTSPAARLDAAAEALARGTITNDDYARIIDYPDVRAITDLHTASARNVDRMLGLMVEEQKAQQPDEYMDLPLAFKMAHERYEYERAMGTASDKIELLRQFIDATAEMIAALGRDKAVPQMAAPGAPGQTTIGAGPEGLTAQTVVGGAGGPPIPAQVPGPPPS